MKIGINNVPPEGLALSAEIIPEALDIETEIIKFRGPIKARAQVFRITNAVTVNLTLEAVMFASCSRCLEEFDINFRKDLQLNYPVSKTESVIDLAPQTREEIILEYPIKLLCRQDCKRLCPKCGENLNEGKCSCS